MHEDSDSLFLSVPPPITHSLNYVNVCLLRHAAQQSLLTLLHIYFPGPYLRISMVPSCSELAECCFPAQMQTGYQACSCCVGITTIWSLQNLVCRWGLKLGMVNSESEESERNSNFSELWRRLCIFHNVLMHLSLRADIIHGNRNTGSLLHTTDGSLTSLWHTLSPGTYRKT